VTIFARMKTYSGNCDLLGTSHQHQMYFFVNDIAFCGCCNPCLGTEPL